MREGKGGTGGRWGHMSPFAGGCAPGGSRCLRLDKYRLTCLPLRNNLIHQPGGDGRGGSASATIIIPRSLCSTCKWTGHPQEERGPCSQHHLSCVGTHPA